jgi:naphthalene 1,2-dioxygenase ferredoxin reductase component
MSTARPTSCARVVRIHDHCDDTRSLFLAPEKPLKFTPGQFISISIPLGDETRSRPYTIASSPEDRAELEICFNCVPGGRGVAWLFDRKVGDELEFIGPFGTFTMDRAPEVEIGLIAEGTSMAPIRPMIRRAIESGAQTRIHLDYAADRAEHILYRSELEELTQRAGNFTFETMIASQAALYDRLSEIATRRWIDADQNRMRQFWICGVGAGVSRIRDLLRGAGYERRAVHYEQW